MKISYRALGTFVLLSLVVSSIPLTTMGIAHASPAVLAQAGEPEREEIISERSTYGRVFRESDGTKTAELFTEPIHFQNDDGTWEKIDNTIVPDDDGSGYRNEAGALIAEFSNGESESDLVTAGYEGHFLSFGIDGSQDSVPIVSGNQITYPQIVQGMDARFEISGETIKEVLVLHAPPASGSEVDLRFPLEVAGLETLERQDGTIDFKTPAGDRLMTIPRLFMYDSSDAIHPESREPALSPDVGLELLPGSTDVLRLTLDEAWLNDPARVYPIMIDPPIIGRNPSKDTYVQSNSQGVDRSTWDEMAAGYYEGPESPEPITTRSLMKFDLSDVPQGSTINWSTLTLFNHHSFSCDARWIEVRRIDQDWQPDVDWPHRPDFAGNVADEEFVSHGYNATCGGADIEFEVRSVVDYWKNTAAPNYGFGIRARSESDKFGWKKFRQAHNSIAQSKWPRLSVNYTDPNRAPTAPTPVSPLDGSGTGVVPTLRATYRDPDSGDNGFLHFQVYTSAACQGGSCSGQPVAEGNSAAVSPDANASWDVPTFKLKHNQVYKWFAYGNDGDLSGPPSANQSFTVTAPEPLQPAITNEPSSPSNDTNPVWTFSGEQQATFTCRLLLNGVPAAGSAGQYNTCSSPQGYPVTVEGDYRLEVYQTSWYERSGPSSLSSVYTLDRTAPLNPRITSSPSSPSNNASPTWAFDNNGQSGTTIYCALDKNDSPYSGFQACPGTSKNYAISGSGEYVFKVQQKDQAGNWSGVASSSRYVFDSDRPSVPSIDGPHPASPSSSRTPYWDFSGESGATFTCRFYRQGATPPSFSTCATRYQSNLTGQLDGVFVFEVRQKDSAGNESDPALSSYELDTGGPNPPEFTARPDDYTNDSTPSWSYLGEPSATFSCELRLGTTPIPAFLYSPCGTSKEYDLGTYQDGEYTFAVKQQDRAGNPSGENTDSFTLDRQPPDSPIVLSTTHVPGVAFQSRDLEVAWEPARPIDSSGTRGYVFALRTEDTNCNMVMDPECYKGTATPEDGSVTVAASVKTNRYLGLDSEKTYWFHIRTVDKAGNASEESVFGPIMIYGEGLPFPLSPTLDGVLVAQSDTNGMEQFYPYRSFSLGTHDAFVNLFSGNLVVRGQDFSIPGKGFNTVIRHTYNAQRGLTGYHDTGLGTGWSLSLADADSGLDGVGSLTDLDLNTPIVPSTARVVGMTGTLGGVLELTDGDGTVHRFIRRDQQAGSRWDSPPGVSLRVREVVDQSGQVTAYELIRPDGVVYVAQRLQLGASITDSWHVRYIRDRHGNELELAYQRFGALPDQLLPNIRVVEVIERSDGSSRTTLQLTYDTGTAAGRLRSITALPGTADERRNEFFYQGGLLSQVVEDAGGIDERSNSFAYSNYPPPSFAEDNVDLLVSVIDPLGRESRFVYDDAESTGAYRVERVCDRNDMADNACSASWRLVYGELDPDVGREVVFKTPVAGGDTSYLVSVRDEVSANDPRITGGNVLKITDAGSPDPVESRYEWVQNRLVSKTDGVGNVTKMTYNDLGLVDSIDSPAPNRARSGLPADAPTSRVVSVLDYDAVAGYSYSGCSDPGRGDPVSSEMYCDSVAELSMSTQDAFGSSPRTVDFSYEPDGDISSISQGARTSTFTYHQFGGLFTVNGPLAGSGDSTTFEEYGPAGLPQKVTDALSQAKRFTYDGYGNAKTVRDRNGKTTTYSYDDRDNLESSLDDVGHQTSLTYDLNDQLKTVTTPRGNLTATSGDYTTVFAYDNNGWLEKVTRPGTNNTNKIITQTAYFLDGAAKSETGPTGEQTTFAYWPNRLVKQVSAPGATGASGRAITDYAYDEAGRLESVLQPRVSSSSSARPTASYVYAPNGAVEKVTVNGAGSFFRTAEFVYDSFGGKVYAFGPRIVSGVKAEQRMTYDGFGQLKTMKRLADSGRWLSNSYEYDLAGNLKRSVQPAGAAGDAGDLATTYSYDLLNRLTAQSDPHDPDHVTTFDYLPEGQQEWRRDYADSDADGPETSELLRSVHMAYNDDYTVRRSVFTDHSKAGSPTLAVCNYEGSNFASGYDADHNLLITRTVKGSSGCDSGDVISKDDMTYDHAGRITMLDQRVQAPGMQAVSRKQEIAYKQDSTIANSTWAGLKTTYGYSPGGYSESVTDWRDATSRFTYFPAGNLATAELSDRASAAMGYWSDGSVRSLTWSAAGISSPVRSHTNITYDTGGLETSEQVTVVPAGVGANPDTGGQAVFDYDMAGRLDYWTSPFRLTPLNANTDSPVSEYGLDDAGNIETEKVTAGGSQRRSITNTFVKARLTSRHTQDVGVTNPAVTTTTDSTFEYSPLGEELHRSSTTSAPGFPSTTGARASTYDPASQTAKVDNSGSNSTQDVEYLYSGSGRLIARVADKTTYYFYFGGGAHLAEETRPSGRTKVRYLSGSGGTPLAEQRFGDDLSGEPSESGPTWVWLLRDPHGSVATELRETGSSVAVAAQRAYDPYGSPDPGGNSKLLNGDPVSSTGFRGANTDKVTGNLLLGARAYDPETDRFTSADFFVGSSQDLATGTDPLTGNRYLFAAANPVGYFDDGHMPLCDGFRCSAGSSNAGRTGGDGDSYGGSSFPSADGANSQRFELSAARGGFVQVDFFIADYSSFALRGDNRDFSSARGDKSSRVRIEIDLAAGHAKATIFKSCLLVSFRGFGCVAAEPLNGADNQISIRNTKSGSILIKYDLINSVTSKLNSGSIDGVVLLVPDGGTFDVITRRDPYPSLEAYQYQGGLTRILAQEDEKPWWAAFPVLTRTQLHDH